jgi:sporulation protein YlmC with PRC-barrel domain
MSKSDSATNGELEKRSDTFLTLADPTQDVRNFKVVDRHDEEIGHVSDLFIDQAERTIQMLEIRAGGFLGLGERHFLLPISAITSVTNGEVHVNQTRERIVGAPVYDPALVVARRRHFGGNTTATTACYRTGAPAIPTPHIRYPKNIRTRTSIRATRASRAASNGLSPAITLLPHRSAR